MSDGHDGIDRSDSEPAGDATGAEVTDQAKPRRTFRMLQPPKDEIRRQREVALAEAAYWKAKCEDAVPARVVLCVGFLLGMATGWLLGWVR